MTRIELVEALERTGTGAGKLEQARKYLELKPTAMAEEVLANLAGTRGIGEGTVEKARKLMSGVPVSEFLGSPPPNAKESEVRALGKEIGKVLSEQLQQRYQDAEAAGIGGKMGSSKR